MLAKIHLKTACGCTREFYQTVDTTTRIFLVPISGYKPGDPGYYGSLGSRGADVQGRRAFRMVDGKRISSRRVELWFEEVYP